MILGPECDGFIRRQPGSITFDPRFAMVMYGVRAGRTVITHTIAIIAVADR